MTLECLDYVKAKNENYHLILHIQINLNSKFQLEQTIWIFGTNFKKKHTSAQKHIKINMRFQFFGTNFPKRVTIFCLKRIK